ncbi:hypothetical protein QO034_07780 [Sedimentitalea sp. JM2-8]|uniref:Protease inhibitor Inh n=2 Tax=Sedimentitalea xiamensis TaxID=3050037 RepID=A0ABT7FD63_9RHOB|nr:hypothetical protein [Sedimentitalea xiamensis]
MILPLALAGTLLGCTTPDPVTVPLRGQLADGSETFSGSATGDLNGPGRLHLVSNRGRTCEGTFVKVSDRAGEGTLTCDDGASGPLRFVGANRSGTGTATLNGKTITFQFG